MRTLPGDWRSWTPLIASRALVLGLGLVLSGCAAGSDRFSSAFVDPARFNLYTCQQLAPERKAAIQRETELEGLMAKARQGAAGPLMAELGYRADYLSARGRREAIDRAWAEKNCDAEIVRKPVSGVRG